LSEPYFWDSLAVRREAATIVIPREAINKTPFLKVRIDLIYWKRFMFYSHKLSAAQVLLPQESTPDADFELTTISNPSR